MAVRREQLGQEQSPERIGTEFSKVTYSEDGHPLSRTDPLFDKRRRPQVANRPVNQYGEEEERRAPQKRISARRAEQCPEYGGTVDQRLDPLGIGSGSH